MTAGVTELTRWGDLAIHLTGVMQYVVTELLILVDHYIKEREEAGSVSSKHKEIKENLEVREARRSVGQSLDALATMHDAKCIFQREDQMRALKKQI